MYIAFLKLADYAKIATTNRTSFSHFERNDVPYEDDVCDKVRHFKRHFWHLTSPHKKEPGKRKILNLISDCLCNVFNNSLSISFDINWSVKDRSIRNKRANIFDTSVKKLM